MAQVTQSLVDLDYKPALKAERHIPSTVNEERQLVYAWEKWQQVRARTTYPQFCRHPEKCCNTGRCQSDPACIE